MRTDWWKWLTIALLIYVVIGGFMFTVPRLPILNETIRVLHFHVPMWFGMLFLFLGSVIQSVRYLANGRMENDIMSSQLAEVGIVFGVLGMITGMFWATFTWGEPWSSDPKQNASAIGLLIYFAYFILRGSIQDEQQRAKIASVYNIFAFAALIPLLFILPRMTDSLHPGNGGNPGFNAYDLDSNLRLVFYPAVIGWTLLGFWVATIKIRYRKLKEQLDD
ncbi:cytochrome c biogenesis protein CcsA [Marinoscillum furvescens]|uniref:cytochrome c biogenesis protein CcsA n=1 Tax=Marinoscillum furvescens TaxID=1026 RepID=UPI000E22A5A8|nr:cytochrome c biogenesis protein CcsA [Marinoscillum furvescens]